MRTTDGKRPGRGPYRIGIGKKPTSDAIMDDPEVVEFADALQRITDPAKRACLEWLVLELARNNGRGK